MLELYYMDILPLMEEGIRTASLGRIDAERQRKAEKCSRPEDKARSICCGLLLQLALKRQIFSIGKTEDVQGEKGKDANLSLSLEELGEPLPIDYDYEKNGKPCIANCLELGLRQRLYFNLSHSGGFVALALSDGEVGVDIQQQRPVGDHLARRSLSAGEYEKFRALQRQGERKKAEQFFFECWTGKESAVKLTGEGLGRDFRRIDQLFADSDAQARVCFVTRKASPDTWLCVSVYAEDGDKTPPESGTLYMKKEETMHCRAIRVKIK